MIWSADTRLDDLVRDWLDDMNGVLDPCTSELYRLHFAAHLIPHFGAPAAITPAAIADYGRKRLRLVKRTTLQKERSTLRGFLDWCAERGHVDAAPELPKLPRHAPGTPHPQRRRGRATELSPEECRGLIDALPLWSAARHGKKPFPVRARFVVAYETTLRPATLDALSAPEHYSRGSTLLLIADAIDKARFGRELPLTDAAREALDSVAGGGLLFGVHDYRDQLSKAAGKALSASKARTFTAYDFRHARLTELAETGNLTGAAYLAGHKRVTTTSLYVRPGLRAAERVLNAVAPNEKCPHIYVSSAKERTRTSTGVTPLAPQASPGSSRKLDIAEQATSLLRVASLDEPVEHSLLVGFARSVLSLTEVGRLALGVLDGGEHAPRRALELARHVASEAGARKQEESK